MCSVQFSNQLNEKEPLEEANSHPVNEPIPRLIFEVYIMTLSVTHFAKFAAM